MRAVRQPVSISYVKSGKEIILNIGIPCPNPNCEGIIFLQWTGQPVQPGKKVFPEFKTVKKCHCKKRYRINPPEYSVLRWMFLARRDIQASFREDEMRPIPPGRSESKARRRRKKAQAQISKSVFGYWAEKG